MKITDVEAFARAGSGLQGAYGVPHGLVLRMATDAGVIGWSESDSCPSMIRAIVEAPITTILLPRSISSQH